MAKKCSKYDSCGLTPLSNDDYCILHSPDPNKSIKDFEAHFRSHIYEKGLNCKGFIIPTEIDYSAFLTDKKDLSRHVNFENAVFREKVNFDFCKFNEGANFHNAIFEKNASFHGAEFYKGANFDGATFEAKADLAEIEFERNAGFLVAEFYERAEFFGTNFRGQAEFRDCIFYKGARFLETRFLGTEALFSFSSFLGPTYFSSGRKETSIFNDTRLEFEEVTIDPPNVISFRNADFRQGVFKNTNMGKVILSGITWPKSRNRTIVYDEIRLNQETENNIYSKNVEELYRQLKQKYEEKRDYQSASDFHYGEKELQRRNDETPTSNRILLNLYKYISGYGERILPAVICIAILILISTICYYIGGIEVTSNNNTLANSTIYNQLLNSFIHSLQATFFVRPLEFDTVSYLSRFAFIIQSIFSPIFIGLLALAIRQRLKR
ncbi:MAG: pentapeptide repeat-containing protein [Bacteroidota bacterium]